MRKKMSSRERILCALAHDEPDHIPLWNLWRRRGTVLDFHNTGSAAHSVERVRAVLDMGLDDTLLLEAPGPREDSVFTSGWNPRVECRTWVDADDSGRETITKEYETPDGTLRQSVNRTEDWPFGDELPITNDYNVSRSSEFLVKSRDDFAALKHLFADPSSEQIREFREQAAVIRRFADSNEIVVEGGWISVVDTAVWLCGMEPLLWKAADDPSFVSELFEIILSSERTRIELLLAEGVDLITHSGWYEMPHFWSPALYRRLIKPILAQEVEMCRAADAHFCYILTAGSSLVADDLLEIGISSIRGIDPVQGLEKDLSQLKRTLGSQIALWGGVNSAVTLTTGTTSEVKEAVHHAIESLGDGGGFVLHPVDSIFSDTPWTNVEAMIEAWQESGNYR